MRHKLMCYALSQSSAFIDSDLSPTPTNSHPTGITNRCPHVMHLVTGPQLIFHLSDVTVLILLDSLLLVSSHPCMFLIAPGIAEPSGRERQRKRYGKRVQFG